MGVNGNGNRSAELMGDALGLRPALAEVMERQDRALQRLAAPFASQEDVEQWKSDALRAAAGYSNEGLDDLMGNSEFRVFVNTLLADKTAVGEQYRARLRGILTVVYGRALREFGRMAGEYLPSQGISTGAIQPARRTTEYR